MAMLQDSRKLAMAFQYSVLGSNCHKVEKYRLMEIWSHARILAQEK
jgi:hypothetical protein